MIHLFYRSITMSVLSLCCSFSYAASLKSVQGRVSHSTPNFDLSRITVTQTLTCYRGWGDGRRSCGQETATAQVQTDGTFKLAGVNGKNSSWFEGSYAIFIDGKLALTSPYEFHVDDRIGDRLLHDFLQSFTIFAIDSYDVVTKVDYDGSYEEWVLNENKRPAGYRIYHQRNSGTDPVDKILPEFNLFFPLKNNVTRVESILFALPGDLKSSSSKYSIRLRVESRFLGAYSSKKMIDRNIALNSSDFYEQLSQIYLETKSINRLFSGLWLIKPSISFEDTTLKKYFIASEPQLLFEVTCEDSQITGHVDLKYRTHLNENTRKSISGSCANGVATFNLSLRMYDYPATENRYLDLNTQFLITDISHENASLDIQNLSSGVIYRAYGGVEKCEKVISNTPDFVVCDHSY